MLLLKDFSKKCNYDDILRFSKCMVVTVRKVQRGSFLNQLLRNEKNVLAFVMSTSLSALIPDLSKSLCNI